MKWSTPSLSLCAALACAAACDPPRTADASASDAGADEVDAAARPDAAAQADGAALADGAAQPDSSTTDTWSALDSSAVDRSSPPDPDGGLPGVVTGAIRVNNLGWRPGDTKRAALLDLPSAAVELRRHHDNSVVASLSSGALQSDEDSGDQVAMVDLSSHTSPGTYYLYLPGQDRRSYSFVIDEDIYEVAGAAAVKALFHNRCNHDHALPYAGDALVGYPGLGHAWVDGTCHAGDHSASAAAGFPDHGALDLHGGWHDAGDYQKTLWPRGVAELLWAYDLNPRAWPDDQLGIPESGNGVADILDEAAWELDLYVRMQRPEGHFLTSVKHNSSTTAASSPPSACTGERVYFDGTALSGGGWSGGGTTTLYATANAVRALAHAAILFEGAGQTAAATRYGDAARAGWAWLSGQSASAQDERHAKCAAAAATYRLDASVTTARDHVEGFPWSTWDGRLPWSVTPRDTLLSSAGWHYLSSSQRDGAVEAELRAALTEAIVDRAFAEQGIYGGLYGDSNDGWDWSWGSNHAQAMYGANLFFAARFGLTGSHSAQEVQALAHRYVDYLLGLNPLNMVYLTNMAAYGAEHSSFQIYHGWFSHTVADGEAGNADYNGKPGDVVEPLYPYHLDDSQVSVHGPAPGFVPGGPNWYYSGSYDIPNRGYPAYAYRDWSLGCGWDGNSCASASWEITEPTTNTQGAVALLFSFVMPAR